MKKVSVSLLFMFIFVLAACGGGKEEPTPVPTAVIPTPLPPSTSTPTPGAGAESAAALQANPWQWVSYLDQATGSVNIADSQNYILTFLADGTVQVKADCNNATGTYTASGSSLTIALGPTTLVACAPESRSDQFLTMLGGAGTYAVENDQLRIDLIADSGNMVFVPQGSAPPPQPTAVPPQPTAIPPTPVPPPPGSGIDSGPRQYANGTYQAPYYTVAGGDTLYSIGLRFGLTVDQLIAANPAAASGIYPGQQLFIPGGGSGTPPISPPINPTYERVSFAPGAISATLNGSIDNNTPKGYVLRALAGQTMNITTKSSAEFLQITVADVNGRALPLSGINGQAENNVTTQLPYTGDYFITIIPTTTPESPSLAFTITFTV
ncbi:MAG TPA: META domain-containing protein, partial [Chloroflexi bacterium]|nr:META domain-containing protein [Chloroflexota bacterium]